MTAAAGRRALVTGGASGIGLEIARRLLAEGADVAVLDRDRGRLDAAAAELGAAAVAADVTVPAQVREAVAAAEAALAGVIHVKPLAQITEADWDLTLDVNLKGAFLCAPAAAPALTSSGRGRVVMISSDAGRRGVPLMLAYTASKFGMIGLAEALAGELAPAVTVNCVCPVGVPTTGMGRQLLDWKSGHTGKPPDEVLSGIADGLPLGRNATPGDVADAVLFLASDAASFITGIALDVDGGASLNAIPGASR